MSECAALITDRWYKILGHKKATTATQKIKLHHKMHWGPRVTLLMLFMSTLAQDVTVAITTSTTQTGASMGFTTDLPIPTTATLISTADVTMTISIFTATVNLSTLAPVVTQMPQARIKSAPLNSNMPAKLADNKPSPTQEEVPVIAAKIALSTIESVPSQVTTPLSIPTATMFPKSSLDLPMSTDDSPTTNVSGTDQNVLIIACSILGAALVLSIALFFATKFMKSQKVQQELKDSLASSSNSYEPKRFSAAFNFPVQKPPLVQSANFSTKPLKLGTVPAFQTPAVPATDNDEHELAFVTIVNTQNNNLSSVAAFSDTFRPVNDLYSHQSFMPASPINQQQAFSYSLPADPVSKSVNPKFAQLARDDTFADPRYSTQSSLFSNDHEVFQDYTNATNLIGMINNDEDTTAAYIADKAKAASLDEEEGTGRGNRYDSMAPSSHH